MRFAVVGVGAIGGYFGGRLVEAGNDVVFVARGQTLKGLQADGLRVESPQGDFHIKPIQVTDRVEEVGNVDCVLLGVKTWQVSHAAVSIRPILANDTCVLPLQNGVEAPAQLSEALGMKHVLGGLCWIISSLTASGHIRHVGVEPYIGLGEMDNSRTERVERLQKMLAAAGIKAEIPASIQSAMWEKFVFICSVSGVGAVSRAPIGQIRKQPETRAMLVQSMQEIVAVSEGHGVALPPNIIENRMAFVDKLPEEGTASMQRDIMEGRPSELEAQSGAVVRLGKQVGVETPLNDFVYRTLMLSEMKARGDI
ncbi:2-dehydropantoate 2-reductase [bacterium]|nr:2-dehydropantoate 2-reductase [bacterium]